MKILSYINISISGYKYVYIGPRILEFPWLFAKKRCLGAISSNDRRELNRSQIIRIESRLQLGQLIENAKTVN